MPLVFMPYEAKGSTKQGLDRALLSETSPAEFRLMTDVLQRTKLDIKRLTVKSYKFLT